MLPKKPREQGEKGGTEEGAHRQGPPESEQERDKAAELLNRGFFQIKAAALPQVREGLVEALGRGVLRLQELGHSASAISSYDEAWELQHSLGPLVSRITGNPLSGDCYSFYVSPVKPSGFVGAHRDKPTADGSNSFRPDGMPMYATVWVALTPATPQSSCLHFVAKGDDAGYTLGGDALDVVLPTPLSWQNIVCTPCEPGDLLCFSHRVVHWASKAVAPAAPRVALSFSVAHPDFETPNFLPTDFPPLALRVGLTAAQAILYSEQVPMHKCVCVFMYMHTVHTVCVYLFPPLSLSHTHSHSQ